MRTTIKRRIGRLLLTEALLLSLASCINDYEDEVAGDAGGTVSLELTIQTRAIADITSSSNDKYVAGTEWENYIDMAGGDYRIYFFEYDPATETKSGNGRNSKLIATFVPTEFSIAGSDYTSYTLSGNVDASIIASLTNFKVVVIANWGAGNYPTVTEGVTTIDDICNANVFSAFVKNDVATIPSQSLHIPLFGLREYAGVQWPENGRTTLSDDITLLRAVAKVEVVFDEDDSNTDSFESVSVVGYNQSGYCAPTNVYLRGDYDHDYAWNEDFMDWWHLTNNGNDIGSTSMTMAMQKTAATSATQETWTCYLTEYDNSGDDYSYIQVTVEGQTFPIYFGNYGSDGICTAYGAGGGTVGRYDIYRNYLYRFYVSVTMEAEPEEPGIRVRVNDWEYLFDNTYIFGDSE